MNGAAYSVQRTLPPSILKSIRLIPTGEVTSQAIAPDTVAAVGDANVSAALVAPQLAVAAQSEFFAERLPIASTASTAIRRVVPHVSLENVNVLTLVEVTWTPSR